MIYIYLYMYGPSFVLLQCKCEQYWPDCIHDVYHPPETTLLVIYEEVQLFADYEIKILVVSNVS